MSLVAAKSCYTLQILHDEDAPNPREDRDNLGTMVCFHRRYNLGDKHDFDEPSGFFLSLLEEKLGDAGAAEEKYAELADEIDREIYINRRGSYRKAVDDNILHFLSDSCVVLPLYLYDHSVISISSLSFQGRAPHAEWDSGQIGWIYASHDKIKEKIGEVTPETVEKARTAMLTEVKEFNYYLTGQCYGFRIFENGKETDSCWGFLGDLEDVKEQIADYLPDGCKGMTDILEDMDDSMDMDEYFENKNEDEEMEDEP